MAYKPVSPLRSLAKTLTWRIVGTLDTIIISWIITGNPLTGMKIGTVEVLSKSVLYYLHERIWNKIRVRESRKRHLLKMISWRVIGTLDTFILSWWITGKPMTGLMISGFEVFSKMFLYYVHERVWYRIDYGVAKRKQN